MKTGKFLWILIIVIVIFAGLLAIYFSFGRTTKQVSDSAIYAEYVSAYTSGMISKKSTVTVKLTENFASTFTKENIDPAQLFDFTPSVAGKAYWTDNQTIEFKPDKELKPGTHYVVEFNLSKLAKVTPGLETFIFEFITIMQHFDVSVDETRTTDKASYRLQKTIGNITLADDEPEENISKIIKAYHDGKEVKIKISASGENKYEYEVDSIVRTDKETELKIKWDGSPIGVNKAGEQIIVIPPLNIFKFLSYNIYNYPEQFMLLQFSDPLDENQLIDGLVTMDNEEGLRFVVEDNLIKVYPSKAMKGQYTVTVYEGIKNSANKSLSKSQAFSITFDDVKPQVRMVSKGNILPHSPEGLVLPFEAVNLRAVDVRIIRIFENNISQFLQVNEFDGNSELKRVGKIIYQDVVSLDATPNTNLSKWNRYTLDLNKLINVEPGAIYRVSIGFRKIHSVYPCSGETVSTTNTDEKETDISRSFEYFDYGNEYSYWDYYEDYDYYDYWDKKDDPCEKAYFGSDKSVSQNIIASDLGLIAKKGNNNSLTVFVTDILTAKPLNNVEIEVLDYARQTLCKGTTDSDGKVSFDKVDEPFVVIASKNKQKGYLKLSGGSFLSLSAFDVNGTQVVDGLKGFIYGERGVWRPGDSLYLTFILEENSDTLAANHPIIFEFRNPDNQLVKKLVQKKNPTGFYQFNVKTNDDALTGNYTATVKAGGANFSKKIKIETIKPNRLKIKFDFKDKKLVRGQAVTGLMEVTWLHGAIAKNLKSTVELTMSPVTTKFDKYNDYAFDDPTKKYYPSLEKIHDEELDENGKTTVTADIDAGESAPGFLRATFITKVFERGGDFSIDQFSVPYFPYSSYIGVKLPKGDKTRGMLLTDTTHNVDLLILDPDGKIVSEQHKIELSFYKVNWKWWWDQSEDYLANYTGRSYIQPLKKETIYSSNGKAKWNIRINYPDWGRYLVIANDLTSGHSTGKIVYIDWPGWAGRESKEHSGAATQLTFTADKDKYAVGESVKLHIPGSSNSRALVSIENGTRLINTYWVDTKEGMNEFSFKTTTEMTPNIYISVTLLQPHSQTVNDLPIRLYGILPVKVENPATHLFPVLDMPDKLRAESVAEIKVREEKGNDMTYTIAIVDEGLLDLTRFKTPDPWENFYAKEALGVSTWDLFDFVIGSFGGKIERILGIGGDGEEEGGGKKKANRFKPMVKFLGPFTLKGGKSATHKVDIPNYIGSVRTMIVAGNNKAYGSSEKTTPVTKPLMVLATLPRVLGPGETLKLPVSIFAFENHVRNVSVSVKTNNLLKIDGASAKNISFKENGEDFIEFDLVALKQTGIAKVEVHAVSGNEKARYEVELDIRNPNPPSTDSKGDIIETGKEITVTYTPIGIEGTNKITLELSAIPPLNLEKRLRYLISYPHGCIEQTTSSAFPQLYLAEMINLNETGKDQTAKNVKAAIHRLSQFQTFNGGLSYWQGGQDTDEWGTSYAGHFLLEAMKKGYVVSESLLKKWKKYQKTMSQKWVDNGPSSQLMQAYRLYTLALSGSPEIGAMNRLKERKNLSNLAKWRLAAAYQLSGKNSIALSLIDGLTYQVPYYNEMYYTYGSRVRDKAMILETLSLLGRKNEAFNILKNISEELSSNEWYSTQSTAFSLVAVSKYLGDNKVTGQVKASYKTEKGSWTDINTQKYIAQAAIPVNGTGETSVIIKNNANGTLFYRLLLEGIPEAGNETDAQNSLKIDVSYLQLDGTVINPESLGQGTDFMSKVVISNPSALSYKQMALSQIFPSGWEIINTRLLEIANVTKSSVPTYQDIRDDRVYTYFDIKPGETKTFCTLLNSSYTGHYYLPAVNCEAMYDATINARKKGMWVDVKRE